MVEIVDTSILGYPCEVGGEACVLGADGKWYRWRCMGLDTGATEPDTPPDYDAGYSSMITWLIAINNKMQQLVETLKWQGVYNVVHLNLDANTVKEDIQFTHPARSVEITTDKTIEVYLNGSTVDLNVERTESPYEIKGLPPSGVFKMEITTKDQETNIKIRTWA
jgi:hypothetical protein